MFKQVESSVKPLKREVNSGTYYLRKNIELRKGTDGSPDMYIYDEEEVSAEEYVADFEEEFERLSNAFYGRAE